MQHHIRSIAAELQIPEKGAAAVIKLLDEGATVPFIARYRKERTGSLDEIQVSAIKESIGKLRELDKRKDAILKSISEQGKLTSQLQQAIENATGMTELEDIYLPFKPKRKTRGSVAKESGLEPLAQIIFRQGPENPAVLAGKFINPSKGINSLEEALQGARDIMAEWINEDAGTRAQLRKLFVQRAIIRSKVAKGKEQEGKKYRDYFEWEEKAIKAPSHRMLAMRRGENEKILSLSILPEEQDALYLLEKKFLKGRNANAYEVHSALKDAYKRLLKPSMENELKAMLKKKADEEAIRVFNKNLRDLLLSPALGQKKVLAIDPGFRTGCKVVCLDAQGKLLGHTTIYPHEPQSKRAEAMQEIHRLVHKHHIEAIAVGNGTAGRETMQFVKSLDLPDHVTLAMVSESGASIYSASEVAREEFPELDLTVRGAVSIGRRMMDPLAELVKIDPKSIGVGQYQHDVDQSNLKQSLDEVVESCVNQVGVELNTASKQLLTYVSGLGPQLAANIISFRDQNGPFTSRNQLKKVPRLGEKAFEQAAGFLRINNAENILDSSAVHPESYPIVSKMALDHHCSVDELVQKESLRSRIDLKKYITAEFGLPTLIDILKELEKPGRDPRESYEEFSFKEGINNLADLKVGMKLPGIVTNITQFGAFVDIGVHQDGLVHISHLSDSFVRDPAALLKVHQKVQVAVININFELKRISLSMKSDPFGKS
jgi:uncharacterized protein